MTANIESLISKRDEAIQKLKQAEADLYYLQGYVKALDELIDEKKREAENEQKDS